MSTVGVVTVVGLDPERVREAAAALRGQADAAEGSAARVRAALMLAEMVSAVPGRLEYRAETWRDAAAVLRGRADAADAFRLAGLEAVQSGPLGSVPDDVADTSGWSGGGGPVSDSSTWRSPLASASLALGAASSLPGLSVSPAPYGVPGGLVVMQPPHGGLVGSGPAAYPTYRPRLPGPARQLGFRVGPRSLVLSRGVSALSTATVLPGVALDGYDSYQLYNDGERSDVNVTVQTLGRTGASTGGAFAGVKAGCMLFGVPAAGGGPVSGAGSCLVGGVIGGIAGSTGGKYTWDHWIGPGVDSVGEWWGRSWRSLSRPRLTR